jgi:hypothetical protein
MVLVCNKYKLDVWLEMMLVKVNKLRMLTNFQNNTNVKKENIWLFNS